MLVRRQGAVLDRAEIRKTTHVCCRDALTKPRNPEQKGRQPNTRRRIGECLAIGRAENERIAPRPPDKHLASIAGSPQIHVIAGSAEHDVAVRGTARRRSTVRPTQDDVVTRTTVHQIVAIQTKHHIVARSAFEDVGAVEGLVRARASLNRRVVLSVIVDSQSEAAAL